jgi:hypothetical protein
MPFGPCAETTGEFSDRLLRERLDSYYGNDGSEGVFLSREVDGDDDQYGKGGNEGHGQSELRLHEMHIDNAICDDKGDEEVRLDPNEHQQNLL